jgi:hypothetical protein
MSIKIDYLMIIYNGDYVLKENLESIYPFANKIIITEGPVKYYRSLGFTQSTDKTIEIIKNFSDPDKKIILIQGQWNEKDDMCRAQEKYFDGGYIWHVDSDELYKQEDMEKVIRYLENNSNCYSVAFRLYSFYGGFDRYISGFEQDFEVIRVQKIIPGKSKLLTHRPPTFIWPPTGKTCKEMGHINHFQSEKMFDGMRIYHYPYVFPTQTKMKIDYYKSWCGNKIISDYWNRLFVPWMRANTEEEKLKIEAPYKGVQEFTPLHRGPAFTVKFNGTHPETIVKSLEQLKQRIEDEKKLLGV